MTEKDYLVGYFDVYAFSNMVQENSLASLSARLIEIAQTLKAEASSKGMEVFIFSDCGFLLCEIPQLDDHQSLIADPFFARKFIYRIEEVCDHFLDRDMLLRGGVACGKVFIDGSMIVGPPIIEAVRLEQAIPAPFILFPLDLAKKLNIESQIRHIPVTLKQGHIIRSGVIHPSDTEKYRLLLKIMTEKAIYRGDPKAVKSKHALDVVNHFLDSANY